MECTIDQDESGGPSDANFTNLLESRLMMEQEGIVFNDAIPDAMRIGDIDLQEYNEDADNEEPLLVNGIYCTICKQLYYSYSSLKAHCEIDHGVTMHVCPGCRKTFRHIKFLRLHIRIAHREDYEVWCESLGIDSNLEERKSNTKEESVVIIENEGEDFLHYKYNVEDLEREQEKKVRVPMAVKHTGIEMRLGRGRGTSRKYADDDDSDYLPEILSDHTEKDTEMGVKRGKENSRKRPRVTWSDDSDYIPEEAPDSPLWTTEEEIPVKRRRRRPKKYSFTMSDEESDYMQKAARPGLQRNEMSTSVGIKRGRERPRKYPALVFDGESYYKQKPKFSGFQHTEMAAPAEQKRGRGRPKKYSPLQLVEDDYMQDMARSPRKLPTIRRLANESPEEGKIEVRQHAYRSVKFEEENVLEKVKQSSPRSKSERRQLAVRTPSNTIDKHSNKNDYDYECFDEDQGYDYFDLKPKPNIEDGKPRHPCPKCGKLFLSVNYIYAHIEAVHGKLQNYSCQYCDSRFTQKSSMYQHMRRKHEVLGDVICKKCGDSFHSKLSLKLHFRVHKREAQKEGVELQPEDLEEPDNNVQLRCPHCKLNFEELALLQAHKKECQLGKIYCPRCNALLSSKACLRNHIANVHNQRRPFVCRYCGKAFISKFSTKVHIQMVHLGMRPFECDYCNKSFKTKQTLNLHIEKYHESQHI